jgi:cytochrome c biogenesis protein CcmG/thiol:disulfide interchange protein DsbE
MAKRWLWLPQIIVAVLLVPVLWLAACAAPAAPDPSSAPAGSGQLAPAPRPGHPAPEIILLDTKGQVVKLSSFKGKPVLINFWATWCPPCRAEMPDLERVWQRYKGEGLVVLGIDVGEDPVMVEKYVKEGGYTWLFLMDSGEVFRDLYRGTAFPSSFFIDKDGIVQDLNIGALKESSLESKLSKILPTSSQ